MSSIFGSPAEGRKDQLANLRAGLMVHRHDLRSAKLVSNPSQCICNPQSYVPFATGLEESPYFPYSANHKPIQPLPPNLFELESALSWFRGEGRGGGGGKRGGRGGGEKGRGKGRGRWKEVRRLTCSFYMSSSG